MMTFTELASAPFSPPAPFTDRLRLAMTALGEEHGYRVLRVCGKGTQIVLVPLSPAVGRAIDRAVGSRN
jgi:hypothetical protein